MSPRKPASLLVMIFAAAATMLILNFTIAELRLAANLDFYDDNSWILYGLFRFYDKDLFPNDYASNYYLSLWIPPFFKGLYYAWAQLADPLILQRSLPIILWLGCAPLVFFTARRLGGGANAWVTLAMYLSSSVFMHRFAASLPHSFASLFVWWAVAALVSGRPISLAICTILSAGFYPIVTPVAGLTLAAWLLFPQFSPLIPKPPLLQRSFNIKFLFLAVAGGLTLLVMSPMLINHFSTEYGRALSIIADREAFPELANYPSPPALTMLLMIYHLSYVARLGQAGGVVAAIIGFVVLLIGQGLRGDKRDRRTTSLIPFIAAAVFVCIVGNFFDYADAYRYVTYTVPVWITLMLPLAFRQISRRWFAPGKKAPAFMLMVLASMSCTAKVLPNASGYYYQLNDSQKHATEFVRTLPKDVMIAGWPGDKSGKIVEQLPYIARRQVLVAWETHTKAHIDYVMTMRERMNAIVDAYLTSDIKPLINLRDKFHVDYLVVNEVDLKSDKPPAYFEPFDSRARELWDKNKKKKFMVLDLVKNAGVYSQDGIDIIDLHKL